MGKAKNSSGWIWLGWFMRLWVIQLWRGVMRAKESSERAQKREIEVCMLVKISNHWENRALLIPLQRKNVHCYAVGLCVQRSLRTFKAAGQPKKKCIAVSFTIWQNLSAYWLHANILLGHSRMVGGVLSLEGCKISTDCSQQINSTITENEWPPAIW